MSNMQLRPTHVGRQEGREDGRGLVFEAHRRLHHSTLGVSNKEEDGREESGVPAGQRPRLVFEAHRLLYHSD